MTTSPRALAQVDRALSAMRAARALVPLLANGERQLFLCRLAELRAELELLCMIEEQKA